MSLPPQRRRSGPIALGVLALIVAAAVPGLLRLEVERDATGAFIPKRGPIGEAYAHYLDRFPGDVGTLVVATGELCTPAGWQALLELAEDLAALPVVDRVTGLPTVEYVVGRADAVEVEKLIDVRPERDAQLCELARAYGPYRSLLLTDDLRAMALYVRGFKDRDEVAIDAAIRPVVERHLPRFRDAAGGDLFQAGSTYQNAEINRLTARSSLLVGAAALVMLLATWWLTGWLRVGALAVLCGLGGVVWTFALMGYLGIRVDPMNALVVQVLIPLGAAFAIHAWGYAGSEPVPRRGLLPEAAVVPFAFAIATTLVGFGATAISSVPAVRRFGLLGVFGIGVCALTAVVIAFPALQQAARRRPPEDARAMPRLLELPLALPRRRVVLGVAALLLLTAAGLARVRVDYGPLDYLPPDNPVRIDMERGGERFHRIAAPLMIVGDAPDAALDPELWRAVRGFAQEMERRYPGLRASWLYDQVAELSLAFTADEAEPVALPDSTELIAQYLLLLDPREVEPYLDWDRSTLVVVFRVPWRTSSGFRPFQRDVAAFAREAGLEAHVTGKVAGFWEIIDRMAVENAQSLAIGLVLVMLLLWGLTRSAAIALVGTLVNAIPVLGSLAFLGFMRIDLDLGSSVVSAIALGIVVDDTGHLLARYEQRRRAGDDPEAAARRMLSDLWRPVVLTSLVIAIGFSVMNLAELTPFHTFSRTLSAAVICALLGDLVLLPALLVHFDRRSTTRSARRRAGGEDVRSTTPA